VWEDFRLRPGSPAVDQGVNIAWLTLDIGLQKEAARIAAASFSLLIYDPTCSGRYCPYQW